MIFKILKKHERDGNKEHIYELLEFMKDLGLTVEHFKEHLMVLCMDKKTVESFDNLASTTKAAFTKIFNQENKDDLVGKKGKKAAGAKGAKDAKTTKDVEDIEED